MQRYLVFVGETYYARGGMHDFSASFDQLDAAVAHGLSTADGYRFDWYHVADSESGKIVAGSRSQAHGNELLEVMPV